MKYLILLSICRTVGAPDWAVWLAGICAVLQITTALYSTWTDLN